MVEVGAGLVVNQRNQSQRVEHTLPIVRRCALRAEGYMHAGA